MVICGKGRARNDFGSGSESPFIFVVPGAPAHSVMGWGDGRIVQVVFFGGGGIGLMYHLPRSYSIRLSVEHSCMRLA